MDIKQTIDLALATDRAIAGERERKRRNSFTYSRIATPIGFNPQTGQRIAVELSGRVAEYRPGKNTQQPQTIVINADRVTGRNFGDWTN